jgi:four helix bundle protein
MTKTTKAYDLEERTVKFGEQVIRIGKTINMNTITKPIINQLIKCSTRIGANYAVADDAELPRDFKYKIGICKKESREAKHFLRMLATVSPCNDTLHSISNGKKPKRSS